MDFNNFEQLISQARLSPYRGVTNGNQRKVKDLYRLNVKLSAELFTIIAYFEVALRNAIHNHYSQKFNPDWIRDSVQPTGFFYVKKLLTTKTIIDPNKAIRKLGQHYTADKIVAEMNFGYWRYLFANTQYFYAGQTLLNIFNSQSKPHSLNHGILFDKLEDVNNMRNRIAHHEPIIFAYQNKIKIKSTTPIRDCYQNMVELLSWMPVDAKSYWYGLDHIITLCDRIDRI